MVDYLQLAQNISGEASQLLQNSQNIEGAIGNIVNESEIISSIWSSLPQPALDGIKFLFNIAKIVGILFVIYLVFLIIKTLFAMKQGARIKSIEKNVKEINDKLAFLFLEKEKKHKEHREEKSEKEK